MSIYEVAFRSYFKVNVVVWLGMEMSPGFDYRVQEFFVRKANPRKGMLVSTHLVVKEPEGSKYEAAKKWNLPAVTMAWLLESARTGKKPDDSKFLIDNVDTEGWFI